MANDHFIVAIGASAGGLEALTSFFEYTPVDGVSYVIIPHLSPDTKSRMVEILSRHSNLEIFEATEGMEVKPNKVYLIPNTKYMGIRNGRLFMSEKEGQLRPHLTIDSFFSSLAKDYGGKAIAIVLSGVGADGTRGIIDIQREGGMVMIQEPTTAQYDGMPTSAISTGVSSYILDAEAMPAAIQQYVRENEEIDALPEQPLSDAFLSNIVNLIKKQHPVDFTDYKVPTLARRITRRMIHHNLTDESEFLSYIQENPGETELLISDLLIGVTSFFRDAAAFSILEHEVIPKLIDPLTSNDYIKIWVTCCATGEEAYSIAILVKEYLIHTGKNIQVKIFATDINRSALDKAGKGLFPISISKYVSAERLTQFFDLTDNLYKVKPELRSMLIFARHDLTINPPFCDVDLISCRNMLIYIKPALQQQILSKLSFGLRKGGYLFLGSSENLNMVKDDFVAVSSKWKIYKNLKGRRRLFLNSIVTTPMQDQLPVHEKTLHVNGSGFLPVELKGLSELMLAESGYSGVCVDQESKVLQAFGDLSPFLRSERFNFNLKELLPGPLALAYGASSLQVLQTNQRVRVNNIDFIAPDTGENSRVDMVVSPYNDNNLKLKGIAVLFKQVGLPTDELKIGANFNLDEHTQAHIARLEAELQQMRQELVASNELLESSREATQAYNEELLSANEEMQSANEELQSINEELETVNREHKYTIDDLVKLNDDLNNYFRSNLNGQLFVDRDILLKKYSPGAVKHINIRESDVGRPLSNITTNIKFETLISDIQTVIDHGETILQEVESLDGKIYQVMTSPYLRNSDQKIYGAVITFYDISELKLIQNELDRTNRMLTLATVAAEIGTWSIDVNTRELICSPRLRDLFGFLMDQQMTLEDIFGQVNPEHRDLLSNTIDTAMNQGTRFELEFPVIGMENGKMRWLSAIGNVTYNKAGNPEFLTGIMYDVTGHKLDDMRKNDFIAIVSHELKTPLTSLTGFIQVLFGKAKQSDDTFALNLLDKANNQVKKMTTLINGFLNVSRLETGKIYLNKQLFEIDKLIHEVVEEAEATTYNQEIILKTCDKLTVNADREKVGQVITNIISNAVKYAPLGRKIEISCKNVADMVQVRVKDEGEGIAPEDQQRLFERFFRVEKDNSRSVPGFGIGLYLSSEIIKHHNGKIWVESEPGEGSTFCFTLPLS
jgi:two-component system CheB/CheR fusion protein